MSDEKDIRDPVTARWPLTTGHWPLPSRSGLTLIELLVVLVVLVAMTTIAVQSLEPKINQSRYDATQATMSSIDAAILGDSSLLTNGTAAVNGFVADMGILPTSLNDLLSQGTLPAPAVQTASGVATITLTRGWRGPYLRLPPGVTTPLDGWGNAFTLTPTTLTPGNDYLRIVSKGSDNATGQTNAADLYTADMTVDLPMVSITGTTVNSTGTPVAATVKLYLPNATAGATTLREFTDADGSATNTSYSFNDVPVGTRVIRATSGTLTGTLYVNVPRSGLNNVVVTVR